jgi:hypothetical protein
MCSGGGGRGRITTPPYVCLCMVALLSDMKPMMCEKE